MGETGETCNYPNQTLPNTLDGQGWGTNYWYAVLGGNDTGAFEMRKGACLSEKT